MIDDLAALDEIHDLIVRSAGEDRAAEDGFVMTGALVIGLYVRADGYAASHRWSFGQMHAYAQEGVLRTIIRDMESAESEADGGA